MKEINIIGHKIPDTDCVLSAIIASDYFKKKWYSKATPFIQWELNNETEYLLKKLNISKPQIKTIFPEWINICLVDHNEESQTVDNLSELNLEWIIDHHKINFKTANPINIRIEPICSTASILYKMYKESNFEISKEISVMMLACIMSDSLLFKSNTTTNEDRNIVKKLKEISWITNLEKFAIPMFDAKSDLWNISIEKIIKYDYKEFDFNWTKAGIWTLETTNPNYWLWKKDDILKWLEKIKIQDNLDFIILSIVDILWEKNTTIVLDWKESKIISEVFNCEIVKNLANLKNRLSRKKQIVPELTKYFEWKLN